MSSSFIIILTSILISISCSLLGIFLVLKKMSMIADSITHTILLGIVIMFLIYKRLDSPLLILGAALVGIITVLLIESISRLPLMRVDATIGLVTTSLFSLAILLISIYTSNIHLDIDSVLLGEIAFTPFYTMNILGVEIPKSIVYGTGILIINFIFVVIFYKELKISTFDKKLAYFLGMYPSFVHYLLMLLVSISSVVAFDYVGAILLISFIVGPASTSYILFKSLNKILVFSFIISIISSILGYYIAIYLDVSISGMISVTIGLIFGTCLIYSMIKRKFAI